ncbi:MAG: putative signal transduction histidine kinase [Bacteroidetes bacterium]|nr:MAG: putative signal transduction histidine kinase [Bacteroidota bacterium]
MKRNYTKKMKSWLVFFFIGFLSLFAFEIQGQHPVFKHFTVDDGLPSTEIYHVIQDSRGFIWIATNIGVSRYDGQKFVNFDKQDGLPENTVFEIYEDAKGRIWFVSFPCQLSYYYNDSIYIYKYNDELNTLAGGGFIPVKGSFSVTKDESIFISFLSKGLYKIHPNGEIIQYYKHLKNSGLDIIEKEGKILLSQQGGSISSKNYVSIETSMITKRLPLRKSSNYSYSNIYASRDTSAIYFAQNEFLTRIQKNGTVSASNNINRIICIQSDYKNNLWVGTDKSGVVCYRDGNIYSKPILNYLKDYSVSSICFDNEGGKWFTTIENGLFYLPAEEYLSYTTADGLTNNKINDVEIYRDQIILGTHDQFINIISIDGIISRKISESINGTIFKLLNENNNVLWIGTNDYLYSIENDKVKKYANTHNKMHLYKNTRSVFCIKDLIVDSEGRLIIGESNGISIFQKGKVCYNSFYDDNIALRIEKVKEIDKETYLLGSADGLWRYKRGQMENLGNDNPYFKFRITDISYSESRDILALGTKGSGLVLQFNDTIIRITKSNGLSSNSISSMILLDNHLWIGTNYGLNVLDVNTVRSGKLKITSYYKINGLISNEINEIQGDAENIYIATNQGLTIFNYSNYKPLTTPPPIYISSFRIMKQKADIKSGYRLKHDQNLISIDYIGISYRNGGNLKYKYRLKGLGEKWNYTDNTNVEYAYLPSGDYLFEVVAINSDGIESIVPAIISFTILPPFWKTWWFMLIMVLVFAILVYLYYINRLRHLKREHALLSDNNWYRQQALAKQMDPHFVFNTLNSIQSFIIKNDRLASTQYLSKFSKLMRLVLNNSQKQAVPVNDEIAALTLYLELESLRFQQKFEYNLIIDPEIDSEVCFIPAFLIQPFLENAIWHGIMGIKGIGRISIEMVRHKNQITCIVEDNGIGRNKSEELKTTVQKAKQSYGTSLVESRLNLLNNLYDIDMKVQFIDLYQDDGSPAGTRVIINLPIIS